jgi:tetratricopeptide (TPR) repeat protein
LVLEPTGVEKGRIVDFLPAEELKVALDRIAAGQNVLADLEAAVQADPDDLDERYRLGHAYALAARRPEAERHFEVVMLGDPKGEMGLAPKVMYDRAMFFLHKLDGDLDGAIEQYRSLQRRFSDSESALRAYRQIGRLQHLQGQSDEAISSLDAMLAEDPDDPALAASYGWFSFREKCQPAAGLRVVDAALQEHPENAELHYLRAELSHHVGNDVAALQAMRTASSLEPKSAYYKRQVRRFEALVEKTG